MENKKEAGRHKSEGRRKKLPKLIRLFRQGDGIFLGAEIMNCLLNSGREIITIDPVIKDGINLRLVTK